MHEAWQATGAGVRLRIWLTPKADRDVLAGVRTGVAGQMLMARVRAVPEQGKANAALLHLVAKTLGRPQKAVTIESGASSRQKSLFVGGDPSELITRLHAVAEIVQ